MHGGAGSDTINPIAANERLHERLRKHMATREGERVVGEQKLAHLVRRQGRRPRHRGVRKNLFDLWRAWVIQSLEAIRRNVA